MLNDFAVDVAGLVDYDIMKELKEDPEEWESFVGGVSNALRRHFPEVEWDTVI